MIDIAVNDAAFQKFLALFDDYSQKLEGQPDVWKSIGEAVHGSSDALTGGYADGAASIKNAATKAAVLSGEIDNATKSQAAFVRTIDAGEKSFSSLAKTGARTAAGVGKAFSGAVSGSVMEMGAGFAGVAESATAAFGPVGIAVAAIASAVGGAAVGAKALMDVAVARQRSAYSLGVTPGQEASFDINAQQFMGPSALAAAANAQLSYGSSPALSALGIDFDAARKMSPTDLAFEMLKHATQAAEASPETPTGNLYQVKAYEALGGQIGDVRNAQRLGLKALNDAQYDANLKAGRLDLNAVAVSRAAALKKRTESFGVRAQSGAINTVFEPHKKLDTAFNAISGEMQSAMDAASKVFGNVATAAEHAFHNVTSTVERRVEPALQHFEAAVTRRVDPALHALQSDAQHAAKALDSIWRAASTPIAGSADAAISVAKKRGLYLTDDKTYAKASAAIIGVARAKGIDPMLALADALQESNLNPKLHYMDHYADGSNAGYSAGLYSLNQNGEGANMTLAQMLDPRQNVERALSEFARVEATSQEARTRAFLRAARGDSDGLSKSELIKLAQTPGAIAALAERPAHQVKYAEQVNAERTELVNAIRQAVIAGMTTAQRKGLSTKPPVHVSVHNSTAARVSVSANAAGW